MATTREAVEQRYSAAAQRMSQSGANCCGDDCCDQGPDQEACGASYSADQFAEVGLDSSITLGCGNPFFLADLHPGEVVLDLGSGGGLDVLLSARRVAPEVTPTAST